MQRPSVIVAALAGVGLGVLVSLMSFSPTRSARAASSDRYQDYVMCTGAVSINPKIQTDGVWMLDYRSGKLLGTVIDKSQGKIVGWAEVDLAAEFDVKPLQDVHFMMTTGYITQGQSALYVAETTTGKFGVYTMGPGTGGSTITIRRHDMSSFRNVSPAGVQPAAAVGNPMPVGPMPGLGQPQAPLPQGAPKPSTLPVPVGPIPGLGQQPVAPPQPGKQNSAPQYPIPVGPIPGLGQTPTAPPVSTPLPTPTPVTGGPPYVPSVPLVK
ncbi:hypothetical protein BH11PLA2_BH11PLA2_48470 [soil metagenome]